MQENDILNNKILSKRVSSEYDVKSLHTGGIFGVPFGIDRTNSYLSGVRNENSISDNLFREKLIKILTV